MSTKKEAKTKTKEIIKFNYNDEVLISIDGIKVKGIIKENKSKIPSYANKYKISVIDQELGNTRYDDEYVYVDESQLEHMIVKDTINRKATLFKLNITLSSIVFDEIPKKLNKTEIHNIAYNFLSDSFSIEDLIESVKIDVIQSASQISKSDDYVPYGELDNNPYTLTAKEVLSCLESNKKETKKNDRNNP